MSAITLRGVEWEIVDVVWARAEPDVTARGAIGGAAFRIASPAQLAGGHLRVRGRGERQHEQQDEREHLPRIVAGVK